MARRPLTGSERTPLPGAQDIGPADPYERLEVSVLLRRRAADDLKGRVDQLRGGDKSAGHLSREGFASRYGADPLAVAALKEFAAGHDLVVVASDLARRTVVLSGTVTQFDQAFGVSLRRFEHDGGTYRGRVGAIHIPDALADAVEAVLGLDNRPQAQPHFRARPTYGNVRWRTSRTAATSFTPDQLATLYRFPDGDGAGECIAIIELGGGYRPADLNSYFASHGVSPAPSVVAVSVDHGKNKPTGDPNGPDGEVMLDIEVAGSIAPQAKIAVYFAPNTDAGFVDAVTTAAHDQTNKPSIISISWGGPESSWTAQALAALDQAFQAAIAMGISVCVASGDNGSSDGATDGADHVDFPASSPHALACGGTSLHASGASITSETVWNDGSGGGASGGGVSTVFALPSWQAGLEVTGAAGATALKNRGVPDVSGDADPETGYAVRIDGVDTTIGGTSAVAPLWAALLARINAIKGAPVGFVNAELYAQAAALNDITVGDNGDFLAAVGWDACTGLGSPDGAKIAAALTAAAVG